MSLHCLRVWYALPLSNFNYIMVFWFRQVARTSVVFRQRKLLEILLAVDQSWLFRDLILNHL